MFSRKRYQLLLELTKNPLSSYNDLAVHLDIDPTTVSRRIKDLRGKGIFHGASYVVNLPKLNMERVSAWVEGTSVTNLKKLLDDCIKPHPYTAYHAVYYGNPFSNPGLFVQFNVPKGTYTLFERIFKQLKSNTIIQKYKMIPHTHFRVTNPLKIKFWYPKYTFDFTSWKKSVEQYKTQPQDQQEESLLDQLDMLDLVILRELFFDMRRKQIDINRAICNKGNPETKLIEDPYEQLKVYKDVWPYLQPYVRKNEQGPLLSKQEVSRRVRFLLEDSDIIEEVICSINLEQIHFFNQVVFSGSIDSNSAKILYGALKHHTLPMYCRLSFNKHLDHFVLTGQFPANEIANFNRWFWQDLGLEVNTLVLDYKNAHGYPLWPGNFIPEKQEWITSQEKIVTDPLKSILSTQD